MRWTTLWSLVLVGLVTAGCGSGSEESPKAARRKTTSEQTALKVANSCAPLSRFFTDLLNLTNQARAEVAAEPLRFSFQLGQSAQAYAKDLATQNFFSHDGKDGSTFDSRIAAKGYDFKDVGENLAAGSNYTARNAFDSWMNSQEGHRENLLSQSFSEVGFGLYDATGKSTYGRYWVQHLGTPKSRSSKGGIYIPDDCGFATAATSGTGAASAVAGRSIFNDGSRSVGSSVPSMLPVDFLASGVGAFVPQQSATPSDDTETVPEPTLTVGLSLMGVMLWRSRRRTNTRSQ